MASGQASAAQTVLNHFARTFGQLASFLISDPDDNAVTAHGFGVGDGATTAFQLQRCSVGYLYDNTGGPWPKTTLLRTNILKYSQAFATGEHLAVQAGTGTGKSLAYLVPAIARAVSCSSVTFFHAMPHM